MTTLSLKKQDESNEGKLTRQKHVMQEYDHSFRYEQLYGERDRIAKEKGMFSLFGWNADNMFFLTRDGDIEITEVGMPPKDLPAIKGLFYYGNQVLQNNGTKPNDPEFDVFGRDRIDRQFIRLCELLTCGNEDAFESLSCKKVDDKYIARVQFIDETLEAELLDMITLVEERIKTQVDAVKFTH